MNTGTDELLDLFCLAAANDLGQLILLHDREPDAELLMQLKKSGYPASLNLLQESEQASDALGVADYLVKNYEISDELLDELAVDYASIYLNHSIQASPMESVWLDDEGLTHQEPMFQVREYLRRYGLQAEDWRVRSDDHLVIQLGFIQYLMTKEEIGTAAKFMDEHLLRWLGRFCDRVATRSATPWFATVALMTNAWCESFRNVLAEILDEPRPTGDEIEKLMKPKPEIVEYPLQYMPGVGPAV
jgi:TorA maturation chaperone TorD